MQRQVNVVNNYLVSPDIEEQIGLIKWLNN